MLCAFLVLINDFKIHFFGCLTCSDLSMDIYRHCYFIGKLPQGLPFYFFSARLSVCLSTYPSVFCFSLSLHLSPSSFPPVCLSYLPSLRAFLGELGKVDRLLWVFLPVLLSTRLDEEGVRRRLPLRLVDVFTHHTGGLKQKAKKKKEGRERRAQIKGEL